MKHMTQADLARAAGVSQSAIASYESRHRLFSRATFQLAAVLKVDPMWLQTGRGSMTPREGKDRSSMEIERLPLREPTLETWPFPTIAPSQFNALNAHHKELLERTACSFIEACLDTYVENTPYEVP